MATSANAAASERLYGRGRGPETTKSIPMPEGRGGSEPHPVTLVRQKPAFPCGLRPRRGLGRRQPGHPHLSRHERHWLSPKSACGSVGGFPAVADRPAGEGCDPKGPGQVRWRRLGSRCHVVRATHAGLETEPDRRASLCRSQQERFHLYQADGEPDRVSPYELLREPPLTGRAGFRRHQAAVGDRATSWALPVVYR